MTTETRSDNGITIGQAVTAPKADAGRTRSAPGHATTGPTVDAPGGYRGKIAGYGERAIDAVAGYAGRTDDPRVGKAKDFVRSKPLAVAALAGVVGLALLNTLRGRGRG